MQESNFILHNPRCSKSRKSLELLQENNVEHATLLYLDKSPTPAELDAICLGLDLPPTQIMRTKEASFKDSEYAIDDDRPRAEWLKILSENPQWLERPIVKIGDRYAIGRPPENILDLL